METVNVTVRMERQTRDDAARFYEGLTVKAIADELFVSRSRLYDAFRNVQGMGVAERLRAERMGAACSLLGSGETDVARDGIRAHLSVRRGISPNVRLFPHAVATPSREPANRTLPSCRTCGLLEHARLFGVAALCVFAKMDCCCIWQTS